MGEIRLFGFSDVDEVKKQFEVSDEDWKGVNVIYGNYGSYSYDGDAMVVFEKDGKLYQVEGSHCSCYGLEGQWIPTETNLMALRAYKPSSDYFVPDGIEGWEKTLKELAEKYEIH